MFSQVHTKLTIIILLFLFLNATASTSVCSGSNCTSLTKKCATLNGHILEWYLSATSIQMKINFSTAGSVGWAAIGFNSISATMVGANIVMGYQNTINEYYATGYFQPALITPSITNATASPSGSRLVLQFTKPLSNPSNPNYINIANSPMNILLVYNDLNSPISPSVFYQHTNTFFTQINYYDPWPCPYYCYGILNTDSSVCSSVGTCVSQDNCSCPTGYSGSQCQQSGFSCGGIPPNSTLVCSSNGKCISQDNCVCNTGYYGSNCENKTSYTYCASISNNLLEWSIQDNFLSMRVTFTVSNIGWGAIGFNNIYNTMAGASIVMGYGSNINEYTASGYAMPSLLSNQRITNASSGVFSSNLVIVFKRPLSDPNDPNYFQITNTKMNILVGINNQNSPFSPSSFSQHTFSIATPFNLFTQGQLCSNNGTLNVNQDIVFPFHYIVVGGLIIGISFFSFIIISFLPLIPPFNVLLYWKPLPPINNLLGYFFNEILQLSIGEVIVLFMYGVITAVWSVYAVLDIIVFDSNPLNVTARLFGQLNLMNSIFILLPVTRHSIWVWVFGIPFERAIKYHRWNSMLFYCSITIHFILIATYNGVRNTPAYPFMLNYTTATNGVYGFTIFGLVAFVCFTLAIIPTIFRRKIWEIFQFSHYIFAPLGIIFACLHHYHFAILISISLFLYLIDLIIRFGNLSIPVRLVSITSKRKITKLVLQAPHIKPSPGQYVFIWISSVSLFESHPFTISSIEDGNIVLFIKSKGNRTYTQRLLQFAQKYKDGSTYNPIIRVEGPYGNPSLKVDNYDTVVFVAGGIGITPVISFSQYILKCFEENTLIKTKNIYISWTMRHIEEFEPFREIFDKLKQNENFKISIHLSNKNTELQDNSQNFQIGRPNYENYLEMIEKDSFGKHYALFACGPSHQVISVEQICWKRSICNNKWHFYTENFEI